MATEIVPGRYTAVSDEPFVVFIIGMRVNRLLAVRQWVSVARAMTGMLRVLYTQREKGFLSGTTFLYWRGIGLVQYWRSFEDLERFATNRDDPHLKAWQEYMRSPGNKRAEIGIWHETYMIEPGKFETLYGNMPVFGLAAATSHAPAVGRMARARSRMTGAAGAPAVEGAPDATLA